MKKITLIILSLFSCYAFSQEEQIETDSVQVEDAKMLETVNIFGVKKEYIKVEPNKTTVSISDNDMLNTSSSYDAIKKLPGIVVAPDGSIQLNGKPVQIQIDDAPSSLSGSDLENFLSGLPAGGLEKVEIIHNPGASYDANASGAVLNLVTNTQKLRGISGNFNINYNFNKYQKPSPQIILRGKVKKTSWNFTTGYNYIDGENKGNSLQEFYETGDFLNQKTFSQTTNRNFYLRTGINHKLSERSRILFNYNNNLANNHDDFKANTSGSYVDDYFNKGLSKDKNNMHEFIGQFKSKIDSAGSTVNVMAFTSITNSNFNSNASDNLLNKTTSDRDFQLLNYYGKVDFSFPIKKWDFTINTGSKYNVIDVKNDGNYLISDASSTILFDYLEKNLAFYLELNKKLNKFNFTAGLRYENFGIERFADNNGDKKSIDFTNSNLFPNLSINYALSDAINLNTSYSKKINQPNYGMLDPNNGGYFDKYFTSQGNTLLNPTFTNNYEFKITAFNYVNLGANYSNEKDSNTWIGSTSQNSDGEIIPNQTFEQFNKERFNAFASFPIPVDMILKGKEEFKIRQRNPDKMNLLFFNVNYGKTKIENYDLPYKNNGYLVFSGMGQIVLPWEIKSSLNFFYLTKNSLWDVYKIEKPIQQFDISFNKSFMNKNLKLGFKVEDVFNQNKLNIVSPSLGFNTNFQNKRDSRVFQISLSWNFGKLKSYENSTIEAEKVQKESGGLNL
ncbi:MAG: TonB-dependent receptor [Flavobacteriales bacterium]|nr:TonB-dependent receptor [Flavobacteriales bacterium]